MTRLIYFDGLPMSMKEFWEEAHRNNSLHALSGVPAKEAWEMLGVEDLIKPGLDALDIGVGLGQNAQALSEAGCNVTCIDISELALARVGDIALTMHARNLELISNRFHLAMGLNLIQHISGQEFEQHMNDVIQALRLDGIYAVETVWHMNSTNDKETHDEEEQEKGWCWRTPEFVAAKSGGKVVKILEHHKNEKHKVWWCTLHIGRNDGG